MMEELDVFVIEDIFGKMINVLLIVQTLYLVLDHHQTLLPHVNVHQDLLGMIKVKLVPAPKTLNS
jgi:hypothetical protein